MKILTFTLAILLGLASLVFGLTLSSIHGQIGNLRDQLGTQLQQLQADRQAQAALSGELASERAAFSQAEARIGGTHRDLITCSDWQGMFLPVSGTDSFNGQISASAGPASLPQHCINQ